MIRFERFDAGSQDAMARCYEIHQRYQSNIVDSPHLLLGLLEQNASTTTQILAHLQVDSTRLQAGIGQIIQKRPQGRLGNKGEVFITPRLKSIIDLAYDSATRAQAPALDTSHLFRALATERDTPLAELMAEHGITPASIDEALRGE